MKSLFSNWTKVAGIILMGGAVAWTIKLCIIVATNGRIIDTGAAALCMKIGMAMLLIGSTGIGYGLGNHQVLWLRIIFVILSPVVVFGLLVLIGVFVSPLFKNSSVWYAQQEAPIAVAVVIYGIIGYILYRRYNSSVGNYIHKA